MNLEQDLRRALRRQPAPPDLVNRVIARLGQRGAPTRPSISRRPAVRWLATAAAITLVALGGAGYHTHQRRLAEAESLRKEAERVQHDVRLALEIAREKLALVQRRLEEPPK